MLKVVLLATLMSFVGTISAEAAIDISGTYIADYARFAALIQVVQTSDGRVTGRYEVAAIQSGGKFIDINAMIDGSSSGGTIVITVRPDGDRPSFPASGSVTAGGIHLSAGSALGAMNINLLPGEEATFRAKVTALQLKSVQILEAAANQERINQQVRSASEFLAAIDKFRAIQDRYSDGANRHIVNFGDAGQRYQAITDAMRNALIREHSIPGGGQGNLERGQISMAIRTAAQEAALLHQQIAATHNKDGTDLQQLAKESAPTRLRCEPPNSELPPCLALAQSTNSLSANAHLLQEAFDHSEQVWTEQWSIQQSIISASAP